MEKMERDTEYKNGEGNEAINELIFSFMFLIRNVYLKFILLRKSMGRGDGS